MPRFMPLTKVIRLVPPDGVGDAVWAAVLDHDDRTIFVIHAHLRVNMAWHIEHGGKVYDVLAVEPEHSSPRLRILAEGRASANHAERPE